LAVSITRTADPAGVAAANTATYTAVSTGTAAADRIVAIAITWEANVNLTSVTIDSGGGDVDMNLAVNVRFSTTMGAAIAYKHVPIGTTATVKVTFSGSVASTANHIGVYRVIGADVPHESTASATSTDMDATSPLTVSVTIPTNGAGLAVASGATAGTTLKTWTSFTEDLEVTTTAYTHTAALKTTAGTANCVCTGSTNLEDGAMAVIVFGEQLAGPRHAWNTELTSEAPSQGFFNASRDWPRGLRTWTHGPETPQLSMKFIPPLVIDWGMWENPRKPLTWIAINPALWSTVVAVSRPANQHNWLLPLRNVAQVYGQHQQTRSQFLTPSVSVPLNQYDWPLPQLRLRDTSYRWAFSLPLSIAAAPKPLNQFSWPLPLTLTRSALTWTEGPQPVAAPTGLPLNQYSWPLPIRLRTQALTWTQSPNFAVQAQFGFIPSRIVDWGIFKDVREVRTWTWSQAQLQPAAPSALPLNQEDWPLPIRTTRLALTWTQTPNFAGQVFFIPPVVTEWGTVPRVPFKAAELQQALPLRATPPPPDTRPRNQYFWPLPLPVRYFDRTWTNQGILLETVEYIFRTPFYVRRWERPYFDYRLPPLNIRVTTPAAMPFNQDVWPLPILSTPRLYGQVFRNPFLASLTPRNQTDWPLPTLRIEQARTWIQSTLALIASAPPPLPENQTDWPLPIRSTIRIYGEGFRNQFLAPLTPRNQTDWPLPVLRVEQARTWIQSTLALLASAPPPQPLNQEDWPLPKLRTRETYSWTFSLPLSIAAAPKPVNQYNWPLAVRDQNRALTWIQVPNFSGQVAAGTPINQYSWPLPAREQRRVLTWTNLTAPVSAVLIPCRIVDWGFRYTYQIPQTWYQPSNIALLTPRLPRNQYQWPLPVPRKGDVAITWLQATSLALRATPPPALPKNQRYWPLPIRAPFYPGFFYFKNQTLYPPGPPPPRPREPNRWVGRRTRDVADRAPRDVIVDARPKSDKGTRTTEQ